MFQKLRYRLLAAFFIFTGLNVLIVGLTLFYLNRKEKVEQLEEQLHEVQVIALHEAKVINDFFTYETKDSSYFITGESSYLNKYHQLSEQLKNKVTELSGTSQAPFADMDVLLHTMLNKTKILDNCVDSIKHLIYERGYKDYGVEGEMREYAHALENNPAVNLASLLMLRRHEKDYIIRNEQKYIERFNGRIALVKHEVEQEKNLIKQRKNALSDINNYQKYFNIMVKLDQEIGIKDNSALKAKIELCINHLLDASQTFNKRCNHYLVKQNRFLWQVAMLEVFIMLIVGVFLSFKLSKLTTYRISLLSENINQYIKSCFTFNNPVPVKQKNDEVGLLISHFELMRQKIADQINYLEVKVAERTEEINTQKEQILIQNSKLTDSLKYALNIQEAVLPNSSVIDETWPEHFVFYQPKDTVSGDFYWYRRIVNERFNLSVIAIADCTGHGVPGAFMSMLGVAFLNDIVIQKEVKTTSDILNKLRFKVLETLEQQQKGKSVNDGMDISLVVVNHETQRLQYSGAMRFMYLIRGNNLIKIEGDRMPIGKYVKDSTPFTYQEMPLEDEDVFYLFTDGFADQIGGTHGKKYLRKNLRKLLLTIHHFPCDVQHEIVNRVFSAWKKGFEQTDDILLAGFKYQVN